MLTERRVNTLSETKYQAAYNNFIQPTRNKLVWFISYLRSRAADYYVREFKMTLQVLSPDFTNWEFTALLLIKRLLIGNNLDFSRSELITDRNLNTAIKFLTIFGHKKLPNKPVETLQRTIQNLRDQGYIDFLGQGEYRLTKKGYETISKIDSDILQAFNQL